MEQLVATSGPERKFQAQLRLAGLFIQQKNFSLAEPLISTLLLTDSHNPDALRLRAMLRIEKGQLDSAIADLRDALNVQPQSVPLMQVLAAALERTGSMELADRYHGDAMRASQYNPGVGLDYVAFLQRRGGRDQSERVLTDLATRNPSDVRVLRAVARSKLAARDWAGAQAVADLIQKLQTQGSATAEIIRAEALSGQSKLSESLQALQAAAQSSPQSLQPISATVRAYLQAKRPDEAEKYLNELLKREPSRAESHLLMASVQLAKGSPEKAYGSIRRAIQVQPGNPAAYNTLAQLNLLQGDLDGAAQAIAQGLEQRPGDFELRSSKVAVLIRKKDFEGAIVELEKLVSEQPSSLILANDLASLLADHRTDRASLDRAQALGAMLRKSEIPAFRETLGWLSYHRGEYTDAVKQLEEAVSVMPNVAEARYHLGMSYFKAGQVDKAREELKKAAELDKGSGMLTEKIAAALRAS